jgi:hypothetical protein
MTYFIANKNFKIIIISINEKLILDRRFKIAITSYYW